MYDGYEQKSAVDLLSAFEVFLLRAESQILFCSTVCAYFALDFISFIVFCY